MDPSMIDPSMLPHDSLGPRVEAVCWSLTGLSFIFVCLRIYTKLARHRRLWWDDWILITAWVFGCSSLAVCSYNISLGFGRHVWDVPPQNLATIGMLGNIVAVLSILAAVWSKTSFAVTLLRITEGWVRMTLWFILISMNVFMYLSAIFTYAQCSPVEKTWNPRVPGTCWDPNIAVKYGIFSGAYSASMDFVLAFLPWTIIMTLTIRTREKVAIAVCMSLGVVAGSTAIVKCTTLHTLAGGGDFFHEGSTLVIWGVAEINTTIIAASIPVLRALVSDMRSSASGGYTKQPEDGSNRKPKGSELSTDATSTMERGVPQAGTLGPAQEDDTSDKSIMHSQRSMGRGKIVKTEEVTVNFHDRSDGESVGFEMDKIDQSRPGPVYDKQDVRGGRW